MKKVLSVLLAVMIFCFISLGRFPEWTFFPAVNAESCRVGDCILFGSYPQSMVTDTDLIANLNAADKNWASYGYYSGTDDWGDGKMTSEDFMQFADFKIGKEKYRAVKFNEYRPNRTSYTCNAFHSFQDENGFTPGITYYFRYEPLKWRVLTESGYIVCENCIDAQAYQNTIYYADSECWQDNSRNWYASDYAHSSIRDWLNYDFYETAFTDTQKTNIEITRRTNSDFYQYSQNNCPYTEDKVFLLSDKDACSTAYGFKAPLDSFDPARAAQGTDYAKCQGLEVYCNSGNEYDQNSWWWLCSPGDDPTNGIGYISFGGDADYGLYVGYTGGGVRPACVLKHPASDPSQSEVLFSDQVSGFFSEEESGTNTDASGETCQYCNTVHPNTFFGKLLHFFHSVLLIFSSLLGKL